MSEVRDVLAALAHGRMGLEEARRWAVPFVWQPTAAQLQDRMTPVEIRAAATWGDVPGDEEDSFDEVEHEYRTGRLTEKQYTVLHSAWRETFAR